MKNFIQYLAALILLCVLCVMCYYSGFQDAIEQQPPKIRVLNDWYMLNDDSLHVYKKGYMYLPRPDRDSIRLDAINKLR